METRDDRRPAGAGVPYSSGYTFSPGARRRMKAWLQTRFSLSIATATVDHATILLLATAHFWLGTRVSLVWLVTYAVVAVLIARQQRGLEVMTHEGSHFNWCRSSRWWNDTCVDALAAVAVFATVKGFRADHVLHHGRIGTADDPCFRRYVWQLDVDNIKRSSCSAYAGSIIVRLGTYVIGWWTGPFGISIRSLLYGALWHGALVLLPLSRKVGFGTAMVLWLLYYGIPFFVLLPPLRFMAEANKHRYTENNGTVFGATFNNVGIVHFLLHPHGDNFHALHHLHPSIPHHKLPRVDGWLMANDPDYNCNLRRLTLLEIDGTPRLSTQP